MANKNQTKNPTYIKVVKSGTYIKYGDEVEVPVSRVWVRQFVEYALVTNQEIVVEVAP
jgi:hypothetical protein